jgi:hypothetical protein
MISAAKTATVPLTEGAGHIPPARSLCALGDCQSGNGDNQDGKWTTNHHGRNSFLARENSISSFTKSIYGGQNNQPNFRRSQHPQKR